MKLNYVEDDYEIHWDRVLGVGLNGSVCECVRKADGLKCALKKLTPSDNARREISLHTQCSPCENVVTVLDTYDNTTLEGKEPFYYLIMEYMAGGELFNRIQQRHSFTEAEASAIMRQICDAIDYLHSRNIAHRDIKPENLLYSSEGDDAVLKLTDFGFAKIDHGNLTTPVYTPFYGAAEVIDIAFGGPRRAVYAYDKSCDMWSVGVLLYILLCGYPPFRPNIPNVSISKGMVRRIRNADFSFDDEEWKNVSELAKNIIRSLLCVDSATRLKISELKSSTWIAGDEAPQHPLQTPRNFEESGVQGMEDIRNQFDQDLSFLRRPAQTKPLTLNMNPILQRRQKSIETKVLDEREEEAMDVV